MKRRHNVVPNWFGGKQQSLSKANSREKDLKKKTSLKQRTKPKSSQITLQAGKKKNLRVIQN